MSDALLLNSEQPRDSQSEFWYGHVESNSLLYMELPSRHFSYPELPLLLPNRRVLGATELAGRANASLPSSTLQRFVPSRTSQRRFSGQDFARVLTIRMGFRGDGF